MTSSLPSDPPYLRATPAPGDALADTAPGTGDLPPLARDMLATHLLRRMEALSASNARRRAAVSDASGWMAERKRLLAAYGAALGAFPERTPLHVRRTGEIERPAYRIEKLI